MFSFAFMTALGIAIALVVAPYAPKLRQKQGLAFLGGSAVAVVLIAFAYLLQNEDASRGSLTITGVAVYIVALITFGRLIRRNKGAG